MSTETIKSVAVVLWMALWTGGLHAAYLGRHRWPVARKVVDVFKAMRGRSDGDVLRDLLIVMDIAVTSIVALAAVARWLSQ